MFEPKITVNLKVILGSTIFVKEEDKEEDGIII